jgi:hypothetical protein
MRTANKLVVAALLAVVLSAAGAFASGDTESSPGSGGVAPFGVIEYLEGEVTVDGVAADIGMSVSAGQIVSTGPRALAEIVFDDRNVFQLREDTTMVLDVGADGGRSVELEEGAFAAVFDRLRQVAGDEAFAFRAPAAVGGVRGTTFYVRVEDEQTTYICTCNGTTELEGVDGADARTVDSGYHSAYRFIRDGESVRTESAPLLYHADAEMDALAAKVGATIPWDR